MICMSPMMSQQLMHSVRFSIDTSFKRLHGWEEFEIETWDNEHLRCKSSTKNMSTCSHFLYIAVVSARAFITSQSAEAHLILFRKIFEIATQDTKIPVQFLHIHGSGFEVIVADGHKGQALGKLVPRCLCAGLYSLLSGLGQFCVELCHNRDDFSVREPQRRLKELNPYDHLRCCYRLCIVHFR